MSAVVKRKFDGTNVRRLATLITITRKDAVVLRLTDHDSILTVGGCDFQPAGGFSASAQQGKEGMAATNMDILGVLDSDYITHEDLRAGLYLEATLLHQTVDWLFPFAGVLDTFAYWITRVTFTGTQCTAELGSIRTILNRPTGTIYTKTCQNKLGDANCQVSMAARTHAGVAVTVVTSQGAIQTDLTSLTDADLNYGYVIWTTGDNAGIKSEVSYYRATNGVIRFFNAPPFLIQVGDTLTAYEGCDGLKTTCKTRYDNLVNFNGVPWLPGNSNIVRPVRK